MPTACTVAGPPSTNVPPLSSLFAVPDPGTGVEPSVVYQMPVLPRGPVEPEASPVSVRVTVRGYECEPADGEIVGAALGIAEVVGPVMLFVWVGGVTPLLNSAMMYPAV